jgi:hypothetical protein
MDSTTNAKAVPVTTISTREAFENAFPNFAEAMVDIDREKFKETTAKRLDRCQNEQQMQWKKDYKIVCDWVGTKLLVWVCLEQCRDVW